MRILVVTGDNRLVSDTSQMLKKWRYECKHIDDSDAILDKLHFDHIDMMIIDISTYRFEELKIIEELRAYEFDLPILVVDSEENIINKIEVLRCGADVYLCLPIIEELLFAYTNALIKKSHHVKDNVIAMQTLRFDMLARVVYHQDRVVRLTDKEFSILELFMLNPNIVISRDELREYLWGEKNYERSQNALDAHIKNLRKKIGKEYIQVVHSVGYVLRK